MVRTLRIVRFQTLGLVTLLFFVTAVEVGRMVPTKPHRRRLQGTPPVQLERGGHATFNSAWFADPTTGRAEALRLPSRDVLENARCSPWVDENGRRQVVGRWSQFRGHADTLTVAHVGLARYSYPDGAVLNYVETGILPFRVLCWYPDTSARVLFGAGDGTLYRFAFENAVSEIDKPRTRPEPIAIRPGVFGPGRAHLSSPCWPLDSRLGGRLLVSVTNLDDRDSDHTALSSIWWLKLNSAGTEVVDAGRVTEPSSELAESSPAVGVARDGSLFLAYLGQRERIATWQLLVAPLHLNADTGHLWTHRGETARLAAGLSAEAPAFSSDARHVMAQRPFWGERPGLIRVPVPMVTDSEARAVNAARTAPGG